ncbi:MAG: FHA domain-containing protein [Aggregatilineales bacterium]
MFRKKEPLETITLTFNPPPDGTYPPRILSPGWTTWLNEDEVSLQHGALIRRRNTTFTLYQHKCKKDILVNGHAMVELHILKDGDHIRIGNWVAIYQHDPVADYKKAIPPDEQTIKTELSSVLKKWVIADSLGLSFDGGKNMAKWGDIVSIEVTIEWRWRVNYNFTVIIGNLKRTKLPTRLKDVRPKNFGLLLEILIYNAPFALSIDLGKVAPHAREVFDAFTLVAVQKIFQPISNNQKELFAKVSSILGLSNGNGWIKILLAGLFLFPLFLAGATSIIHNFTLSQFIHGYIRIFLVICVWFLILVTFTLLPYLAGYISRKIKQFLQRT